MTNRLAGALLGGAALILVPGCKEADGNEAAVSADGDAETAPVSVGGTEMDPNRSFGQNLAEAGNLTRFVAAVDAAGLSETLEGVGPYTVFAPTDDAFGALPEGTFEGLTEAGGPELVNLVSYHIVPGVVTSEDLAAALDRSEGDVSLATMTGAQLTVARDGDGIVVRDGAGGTARLSQPDVIQSNGVLHVVDMVLNPGDGQPGEGGEGEEPAANEAEPAG